MIEHDGLFSIPTRLLLTAEQRARLESLVHERDVDLVDLLSEIVADYLEAQDIAVPSAPAPDTAAELQRRRAELARLRSRSDAAGQPAWLVSYISALESEVARLEGCSPAAQTGL